MEGTIAVKLKKKNKEEIIKNKEKFRNADALIYNAKCEVKFYLSGLREVEITTVFRSNQQNSHKKDGYEFVTVDELIYWDDYEIDRTGRQNFIHNT